MSRNTFGVLILIAFILLIMAESTNWERFVYGAHATTMVVFVPAAIKTLTIAGGVIFLMILLLRVFANRRDQSTP